MQRASLLAAVSLCACASGAGGSQVGPDGAAAAACDTSAACDDGDRCTAEACDLATGTCVVSAIDWCAGSTPVAEEDFESRPERPVSHDNFFSAGEGEEGWQAAPTDACPVDVAAVVDDDFEGYGKPAAFVHGAGGWLFTTPAGGSVSLVSSPDGGYAMNVVGSTASGSYGQAAHPLTPQPSGWVELRVRAPGNFKPKMVQLAENGDTRFSLVFDADGQIKYSSGGALVALRGYVADTWYPIRLEWDGGRDRASLELAGADHPDLPLHAPIAHYVDAVRIKTATATGLSVMVDEVRASGGEGVHDGGGSLRVGAPLASCGATSNASLAFAPARSGVLELDLMAEGDGGPYEIRLVEGGDGAGERMALSLEAGEFYWSQGAVRTNLPVASRWSAGDWVHVSIRWQADLDAVDVAIGDDPPAVRLRPSAAITSGVDRLRVIAPPGGALWVDDLHIAATGDP